MHRLLHLSQQMQNTLSHYVPWLLLLISQEVSHSQFASVVREICGQYGLLGMMSVTRVFLV